MLTTFKNWNWKEDFNQLKKMIRLLFPKGKTEIILFVFFFCIYGSLATFMALQTNITDQIESKIDAYLAFDSQIISHKGRTNIVGHPLIQIFTLPFIFIGIILNYVFGTIKAKALFLVLVCTFLTSSSNIFVYRYLKEIIEIKSSRLLLIILLYSCFAMNFILAFTYESFTFSLYFLSFSIFYYSYNIKHSIKISFLQNLIIAITLGGITITNFAKGIVPILFLKEPFRVKVKRVIIISFIFLCIITCILADSKGSAITEYQWRIGAFSTENNVFNYFISFLWGTPILLPQIIQSCAFGSPLYPAIYVDFYNNYWQYVIVTLIGILSIYGILSNISNTLIYIPIGYLSIDIIIHIFIRYGIHEGMIYGGHWIFLIPIFIGWGYKNLTKKHQKILDIIIAILFIALGINNINQMNNFIKLALDLFPA